MARRTIGKRWPKHAPPGDSVAMCDQCGVHFRYSQLRVMEDGTLQCFGPGTNNDGVGRVSLTLAKLNAQNTPKRRVLAQRRGNYDRDI